jgi:hypothetical protein
MMEADAQDVELCIRQPCGLYGPCAQLAEKEEIDDTYGFAYLIPVATDQSYGTHNIERAP